jgi:hypothetical protein
MEEKKLEDSVVKAHSEDIMEEPDKVSFHYDDTQNAMVGEAGLDQAPDGGCEAWTVILGAACVSYRLSINTAYVN